MTSDQRQEKGRPQGGEAGRARSFAVFALSEQGEILRCTQNDSEGLRMTAKRAVSEGAKTGGADGQTPA